MRNLKLPRVKLPEALANALRLYGYNWRGKRSRDGKLWTIYPYGKPGPPQKTWPLHSDADPEEVVIWLVLRERGEFAPDDKLLKFDPDAIPF
jgi:hypothetical protein